MKVEYSCGEGVNYEPRRHTDSSIGYDLCAADNVRIDKRNVGLVPTSIKIATPEGYGCFLFARSSMVKRGFLLANGVGVIDPDYRGEIFVPLLNVGKFDTVIQKGERIAQLVFLPVGLPDFEHSETLSETERGEGGFGSTGTGSTGIGVNNDSGAV